MARPDDEATLPDPATRHPIVLPDGTPHAGTVFLRAVIDPQYRRGRLQLCLRLLRLAWWDWPADRIAAAAGALQAADIDALEAMAPR